MDIKIVDDNGQEVVQDKPKEMSSNTIEGSVAPELQIKAVGEAMGLEKDSERGYYQDKINTLLEWAKLQTNDHSPEGLKSVIRTLEYKLGTTPLAEKKISYISRYAYLLLEELKIQKERKGFERK